MDRVSQAAGFHAKQEATHAACGGG
eukprot:COSAG03_NODE_16392_length_403_cov_0.822368_1_plen_24_part_10